MKIYLVKQRMDRGGYINKGRDYFGLGDPVYTYSFVDFEETGGVIRAKNRKDAKRKLLEKFPGAKFFN